MECEGSCKRLGKEKIELLKKHLWTCQSKERVVGDKIYEIWGENLAN